MTKRPRSALLLAAGLVMGLVTSTASVAAPVFNTTWDGGGDGARSSWSLKSGNVVWSSNFRSPVWNLSLVETKGSLKFNKSQKNHFEIWFVNADQYDNNPSGIVPPAVVVDGDASGVGSTPHLIYNDHVTIGYANTLDSVSTCVAGGNSGFTCSLNAVFSQKGGTLSNYENGDVLAIATYIGNGKAEDVLTFTIPAASFPFRELGKTSASTFAGKGTTVEKTYTTVAGKSCTQNGQLAHGANGNLQCTKVEGKLLWVEAGNTTVAKSKTTKAKPKCTPKQGMNLDTYMMRIDDAQIRINNLEQLQQQLRDRIVYNRNHGIRFDEDAFKKKIDANQSEIIATKNTISQNVKLFHSIDNICLQHDYVLPDGL